MALIKSGNSLSNPSSHFLMVLPKISTSRLNMSFCCETFATSVPNIIPFPVSTSNCMDLEKYLT